ncbi:hypothetical protein BSKO_02292 [Bryopsis sp. KO-2023]|nr:hypothetical protein BSKO_02292 [Bryopsis sp. KO-2023]
MAKDELAELLDGPLGDDWLSTVDLEYPFADTNGEVAGVGGQELLLTYLLNGEHCRDTCEAVSSVRATAIEDVVDDKQVVLAAAAAAGLTRGSLKHAFSAGDIRLGYSPTSPKLQHTRSNVSSLISVPEAGTIREFESVAIPDSFTSSSQPEGGGAEAEMDERSSGDVLGILSTEELEQELSRRKAKIPSQPPMSQVHTTPNLFGAETIGIGRVGQRRSLHQVHSQGVFQPFQSAVTSCGLSVAGPSINYQSTNPVISTISGISGNSNHSGHSGLTPPVSGLSQGLLPQLAGSLSSSLIQAHQNSPSQGMSTQPSYNRPIQYGVSGRENSRYTLPASHSGSSVPAVYQPTALTYSGVPRAINTNSYTVQPAMSYAQPPPSSGLTMKTTTPQADSNSSNNLRKCHSTPILPSLLANATPGLQIPVMRGDAPVGEERRIGKLTPEERRQKILRYRQKRNERRFDRRVTYQCRKTLADTRPRVRGRFARNDDKDAVMPPELKPPVEKRRKSNNGGDPAVEVVYLY